MRTRRTLAIMSLVLACGAGVGTIAEAAFAAEATRLQAVRQCVGDCSGDEVVTIDEIITGLNIAFRRAADRSMSTLRL